MLGYIVRRILAAIPVMAVVALFVFLLLRLTPGDPAAIIAGDVATPEQLERIRTTLGLDQPIAVQFVTWIGQLLSGNLGTSLISGTPVTTLIAQRLEPTVSLALLAITLSVLIAVPLGVIAAWRHRGWLDTIVMTASVLGFSLPVFVVGYIFMQIFAIDLKLLPVQGFRSISAGLWPFLERALLPALTVSTIYIALIARTTRASMLDVLGEDYVRTARAKGLSENIVLFRHALRNAANSDPHRHRHGVRADDLWRCCHRKRVQHSRSRAADRRCDPRARLSGNPGPDPADQRALCRRQPADRPFLCAARSEDPLLMAINARDEELGARWRLGPRMSLGRWRIVPAAAALCLLAFVAMAVFAPLIAPHDPLSLLPAARLKPPSATYPLGTDAFGRDLLSRVIYGARVSLIVGVGVALTSIAIGLPLGLAAGFFRVLDAVLMRIMDGLMAIPSLLLAIAIVSLTGASLWTMMVAITVPEVPRIVRLVRSVVLSAREEPYVEAAIALGSGPGKIMWRHLLPNTLAPLIVQGTYVCASAILIEAILSFLGAELGTETPSWGNVMSEGALISRSSRR